MSLLKSAKTLSTRNPSSALAILPDGGALSQNQLTSFMDVLSQDVGLDIIKANDAILLKAMDDPLVFLGNRADLMTALARVSAQMASQIVNAIKNIIPEFPDNVLNDIARNIGSQVLSTAIKSVDAQIGGVNDVIVKRITNSDL